MMIRRPPNLAGHVSLRSPAVVGPLGDRGASAAGHWSLHDQGPDKEKIEGRVIVLFEYVCKV